jgi:hypothetical protein
MLGLDFLSYGFLNDEFFQPLVFLLCFFIMGFSLINRNFTEIQNSSEFSSDQNQSDDVIEVTDITEDNKPGLLNRLRGDPLKKAEKQLKNSIDKIGNFNKEVKYFEDKINKGIKNLPEIERSKESKKENKTSKTQVKTPESQAETSSESNLTPKTEPTTSNQNQQ